MEEETMTQHQTEKTMPDEIWASDKTRPDGGLYWYRPGRNLSKYIRADLSPAAVGDNYTAKRVKELTEENEGFWRSCSGCYEMEDGHPVGLYEYNKVLQCDIGSGCRECGGIGAVWDSVDYEDMARSMQEDALTQPAVDEWIKTQPHEDYECLKKQFQALKSLLNSQGQMLSYYRKKDYETGEAHLKNLSENLESERNMNAELTSELDLLRGAVPEEFVLVPIEPTNAMRKAWNRHPSNKGINQSIFCDDFYKAMILAAKPAEE
jgi:hypothetical protein